MFWGTHSRYETSSMWYATCFLTPCGFKNAVLIPQIPFPILVDYLPACLPDLQNVSITSPSKPFPSASPHPLIDLDGLYVPRTGHCTVNTLITLANEYILNELLLNCFQSEMIGKLFFKYLRTNHSRDK